MSLSVEPAFSLLKSQFICGVRDISKEPYSGISGKHAPNGKGIKTTNGAGPHNLQLFVLAPDGTVLHCLPGYWSSADLTEELLLAQDLYKVWQDPGLSYQEKNELFSKMQLAHLSSHSPGMVRRSHMQSFDQKFEARWRPYSSDTIRDPKLAIAALASKDRALNAQAFKSTDEIMHERMSRRPFMSYENFDVAAYTDYGRPKYEKHEDYRDANGNLPPKNTEQRTRNVLSKRLFSG